MAVLTGWGFKTGFQLSPSFEGNTNSVERWNSTATIQCNAFCLCIQHDVPKLRNNKCAMSRKRLFLFIAIDAMQPCFSLVNKIRILC